MKRVMKRRSFAPIEFVEAPRVVQEVDPGQIWSWIQPHGKKRTMLVQRIQNGPQQRRAMGINPHNGRRLQCSIVYLTRGSSNAKCVHVVEGYRWEKVQPEPKKFRTIRLPLSLGW
jgi:hypothetical protein